ncbi:hypothetical protein [Tissierella praeacuta]|nr:hypothetical protein [Tissierella praeacuta]
MEKKINFIIKELNKPSTEAIEDLNRLISKMIQEEEIETTENVNLSA